MSMGFTAALFQQNWMKIVRILFVSSERKRSLRELVDLSGLSPGGVQDVMRRLEADGLVSAEKVKNRLEYSLNLSGEERKVLENLVGLETKRELRSRGERFSTRRVAAVGWIDETLEDLATTKLRRMKTSRVETSRVETSRAGREGLDRHGMRSHSVTSASVIQGTM